jgi:hypothetical protein
MVKIEDTFARPSQACGRGDWDDWTFDRTRDNMIEKHGNADVEYGSPKNSRFDAARRHLYVEYRPTGLFSSTKDLLHIVGFMSPNRKAQGKMPIRADERTFIDSSSISGLRTPVSNDGLNTPQIDEFKKP